LDAKEKTPEKFGARLHFASGSMGNYPALIAMPPGRVREKQQ
jgi:hypothetical protein